MSGKGTVKNSNAMVVSSNDVSSKECMAKAKWSDVKILCVVKYRKGRVENSSVANRSGEE